MQSKRNALLLWFEMKERVKEKEIEDPKFNFPAVIVLYNKGQRIKMQMDSNSVMLAFTEG